MSSPNPNPKTAAERCSETVTVPASRDVTVTVRCRKAAKHRGDHLAEHYFDQQRITRSLVEWMPQDDHPVFIGNETVRLPLSAIDLEAVTR